MEKSAITKTLVGLLLREMGVNKPMIGSALPLDGGPRSRHTAYLRIELLY